MNAKRWIKKIALLLCPIMLCSMTDGIKANAGMGLFRDDITELEVGDYGWGDELYFPSDYVVTVNGKRYTDHVSLHELGIDTRMCVVNSYIKDDVAKTIDIVIETAEGYQYVDIVDTAGLTGDGKYFKTGTEVTVTASIPEEYQSYYTGFGQWYAFSQYYGDGHMWHNYDGPRPEADIGLSEEELSQRSITFTVPDSSVYLNYDYYINTVSGNTLRGSWTEVDTSYLTDVEVSVNDGEYTGNTGESLSDNNGNAMSDNNASNIPNIIQTSNGVIQTSDALVHYVAKSVAGVLPMESAEIINKLAGLSDADIQSGIKAKFYIGDVYKPAVKKSLQEAAGEKGTIISMLDIDLYTLGGKNGIHAVRNITDTISIVIGIPQGKQAADREYSLICIKDGNIVEVKDKDNDIKTFTADLDYFGAYALIYK